MHLFKREFRNFRSNLPPFCKLYRSLLFLSMQLQTKMSSSLLPTLLVLSFLLYEAQGIRMGRVISPAGHVGIHEEDGALIERNEEAIDCKDGNCKGRNRKLLPKNVSSSTTTITSKKKELSKSVSTNVSSKEESFKINPSPVLSHHKAHSETYPDILDIAGMDYTPAKRKPPIHN